MTLADTAMLLAIEAHGETRNKHDGEMYTSHLARVWINVRDSGGDEVQQAIAWLHDAVEDGFLTYDQVREAFTHHDEIIVQRVVEGVRGLTKIKGESNKEYYHRCRANPDSRFVKRFGDLVDNFRRNHSMKDDETRLRMAAKYSLGMDILS